jgi:hypothetical protein
MANKLPDYVVRPGEPCHQPPFACDSTQLYGFYVEGDRKTIQEKLIDPALNHPTDGKTNFHTFTDFVMITYSITERGTSTEPPDSDMGYVPEYCWTVWVPVISVKKELGLHVAEKLLMYPAFIQVDNAWSLVAGREVYGFPKNQGPLTIPAPGEDAALFSNQSLAFTTYAATSKATMVDIMSITRTEKKTTAGEAWDDLGDAIKAVAGFLHKDGGLPLPGLNLLIQIFELAKHREVPAIFLKQFRDAAEGTKACYQALVEAGCEVTKFSGGGLLDGTYQIKACDYPSMPLASSLGIDPNGAQAHFPFWTNIDFFVTDIRYPWKA